MKKKILRATLAFVLLVCAAITLTACKSAEEVPPFSTPTAVATEKPQPTPKPYSEYNETLSVAEIVSFEGMYVDGFGVNQIAELEEKSDEIVLATVQRKRTIADQELLKEGLHNGTTVAEVKIEEVFFSSEGLKKGDVIEIQEYCYLHIGIERTVMSTSGYYYPMKENETYLLFLEVQDYYETEHSAKYTSTELWYGKYLVNPTAVAAQSGTISCETMELAGGEDTAPGDYIRLFGEVCEKYYTDEAVQTVLEREEILAEQ